MNEELSYMEAYFTNQLPEEERMVFEERCISDESFANEVAFYVSARKIVKDELLQKKQQQWQGDNLQQEPEQLAIIKKINRFNWIKYAAAACLVLAIATYFFERPVKTQQLASDFINKEFTMMPQTMGVADDMETAKQSFNRKDYKDAIEKFNKILSVHPANEEALTSVGIAYLVTNNYSKAIDAFDRLSKMNLQNNPGLFYKAVTLLKRNEINDKATAKQLLEQVAAQELDYSNEAKEWLKHF